MGAFARILLPTDFGAHSERATKLAVELATTYGSRLTLLHVFELPAAYDVAFGAADLARIEEVARGRLDAALASVHEKVPDAEAILRSGIAWRQILSAIRETQADLVVIGTRGRRGLSRALIGSVAERIVRLSPVPVLTASAGSATIVRSDRHY